MKKRYFLPLVALALVTLVGCGNNEENPDTDGDGDTTDVCEDASIILDATKTTLIVGETSTITSTVVGCDNEAVTYSVESGDNFIELSEDGVVTATSEGTATVKATLDENEDVSNEITFTIYDLNEQVETVYDAFDSFDYEKGITLDANIEIDLGTISAGTYLEAYDFVVDIPLELTIGIIDDDPLVKVSLDFRDISGTSITLEGIDISSIVGFPYTTEVTIHLEDVVKSYLAQYIFTTQYTNGTYGDIQIINFYSKGDSNLYVELEGDVVDPDTHQSTVQTMEDGFYTFDISELVSSLDDVSASSWEKSDIAYLISMLEMVATVTTTEISYNLSLGSTVLELLNSFWSELGIGGDYEINVAELSPDLASFGIENLTITGLRVPSTITDLTGTIYNDAETDLKFNYIEVSISGTTENITDEFEFLNLKVYCPEQIEDETISSMNEYLNNLISTSSQAS